MVIIVDFVGHKLSVTSTQLWHCSMKAAVENMKIDDHNSSSKTLFTKTEGGPGCPWLLRTVISMEYFWAFSNMNKSADSGKSSDSKDRVYQGDHSIHPERQNWGRRLGTQGNSIAFFHLLFLESPQLLSPSQRWDEVKGMNLTTTSTPSPHPQT